MRRNHYYNDDYYNDYDHTNEEFTPWLRALGSSISKAWSDLKSSLSRVSKDFSKNFEKSKTLEKKKQTTIDTLTELKKKTTSAVNGVENIKEIQDILKGFEETCNDIMSNFKTAKVQESMLNENLWISLKTLAGTFSKYWSEFRKSWKDSYDKKMLAIEEEQKLLKKKQDEIQALKKGSEARRELERKFEQERKRAEKQMAQDLKDAKDAAIEFINDSVTNTIKSIRAFSPQSQSQSQGLRAGQTQKVKEGKIIKTFETFVYRHY